MFARVDHIGVAVADSAAAGDVLSESSSPRRGPTDMAQRISIGFEAGPPPALRRVSEAELVGFGGD
jgi:hypothetical protein